MTINFEEKAKEIYEFGKEKAQELLENSYELECFLEKFEKKLKEVPTVGNGLSKVPVIVCLLISYLKKEYTDIPKASIIAIVSSLLYLVLPVDVIPDAIPVIGLLDDIFVIGLCWNFVKEDVEAYENWRIERGMASTDEEILNLSKSIEEIKEENASFENKED